MGFFRHEFGGARASCVPTLSPKGYATTVRTIHCNALSFITDPDEMTAAFKRVREIADEVRAEIKQERMPKEAP